MKIAQTLEQRRAHHAWESTQRAKTSSSAGDYSREAKRLPIRIMTAGLGHAIAFSRRKSDAGKSVVDDVACWVLELNQAYTIQSDDKKSVQEDSAGKLLRRITESDADWLRRSTEEAISYLKWLSRFAEAELKDETSGQEF
ncbi:MAG: type III-B CRISPR module-associated protein Cmr5 [Aestuariivita sp.]|nr:type III-B CRISPR module-associated protein Cmr5 [Aestuariivita sp.]